MTPLPEDHASFGHPIQDTGCQSTIIPLRSANNLGVTEKDLLPAKLVMRGAIKEDLGVISAVAVNVTTKDSSLNAMSTRLMCYVSDTMEILSFAEKLSSLLGLFMLISQMLQQ